MCGVFGFAAMNGGKMSIKVLERVARVTMSRGPHAWGMAWIDSRGRLKMFKQTGRIVDALPLLAMAADAKFLIGHCRYATDGDPAENGNNHPHPVDGGWFVHNGVIRNFRSVIRRFDLHPSTACDSEVLGLLVEQSEGEIGARCVEAVQTVEKSPLVMLGLWKPGKIVAVRQGNPLSLSRDKGNVWLASLTDGLPGKVYAVGDERVIKIAGGEVKSAGF